MPMPMQLIYNFATEICGKFQRKCMWCKETKHTQQRGQMRWLFEDLIVDCHPRMTIMA